MTLEVLDDDILDIAGQLEPPRRGRPASAQAKRDVNLLFADKTSAPATESWWVGLSPAQFYAKAEERFPDMQKSKFGRMKGNIPESPA